jgi:hypothetical protein
MYKVLSLLMFIALAQPASANDCPASYRFVDFGVEGEDGEIRRGGTIFRAFNADGTRILVLEQSICRTVTSVSIDGRALPIPVVSTVSINPSLADLDLTTLELRTANDAFLAANINAVSHRGNIGKPGAVLSRGQDYVCVGFVEVDDISCEFLSPYGNRAALVIYCNTQHCEMPALARDAQLVVSAVWRRDAAEPDAVAQEIRAKVDRVRDFLEGQI